MSNPTPSDPLAQITSKQLFERIQGGETIDLIDVRTPAEYQSVHASPARLVAMESLDPLAFQGSRGDRQSEPLYVICASGGRSRAACERFRAAGVGNVVNVTDGTIGWERQGLPVVRGTRRVIPLDRQVRIAAGSLTAIGTVLGAFVHPVFLAIPALVGSGLVFAGVTDFCGMALLLARMPWNQATA